RAVRAAAGLLGLGNAMVVVGALRRDVAFAGAGDDFGVEVVNLLEYVAERLADADRLAAEPGAEVAQPVVEQNVPGDEAGRGRHPVAHRVDDELRPALTPQVSGHFGGVRGRQQAADVARALGLDAVHLADAKHRVRVAVLAAGAAHVSWFAQLDSDG